MAELFHQALFPVNLPLSILFVGLLGYWLLVSLGIFDLEGDGDLEVDAEVEAHGPLHGLMQFLNVGEVPVMVVLSILVLCMWVLGILSNHFLNDGSILLGLVYLIPNFVISVVITRYAALPFRKVFKLLNHQGPEHLPLIGRTCVVQTKGATDQFGQAEVQTEGAPILLQVRTQEGQTLSRGESALIIGKNPETGTFTVVKVTNDTLEA